MLWSITTIAVVLSTICLATKSSLVAYGDEWNSLICIDHGRIGIPTRDYRTFYRCWRDEVNRRITEATWWADHPSEPSRFEDGTPDDARRYARDLKERQREVVRFRPPNASSPFWWPGRQSLRQDGAIWIPLWPFAVAASLPIVLTFARQFRGPDRSKQVACGNCGSDRGKVPAALECPECGAASGT